MKGKAFRIVHSPSGVEQDSGHGFSDDVRSKGFSISENGEEHISSAQTVRSLGLPKDHPWASARQVCDHQTTCINIRSMCVWYVDLTYP